MKSAEPLRRDLRCKKNPRLDGLDFLDFDGWMGLDPTTSLFLNGWDPDDLSTSRRRETPLLDIEFEPWLLMTET